MRLLVALILTVAISGCAHKPGAGSYLDAATTYAVVESSSLVEANPLLSGMSAPAAALSSIALKQAVKVAFDDCRVSEAVETAGIGAGAWNLGLLAGAAPALAAPLAVASAVLYWDKCTPEQVQ